MKRTRHAWGTGFWVPPPRPRPGRLRRLAIAVTVTFGAWGAIFFAFITNPGGREPEPQPQPITVALVDLPDPEPPPGPPAEVPSPPAPAAAQAAEAAAPKTPTPPRPVEPVPAIVAATPSPKAETPAPPAPPAPPSLSAAELASATTAGSGLGVAAGGGAGEGGSCNMVAWLQDKLRQDSQVRRALIERYRGERAAFVWNGEWLVSPGEEGEGLAVLRQAMMVHIAFAPEACREDPVSGLVVIALDDNPSNPKIALGTGRWEWTDLLGSRTRLR